MAFTRTWNAAYEDIPADTDDALEGALRIRNLKEDIRERLDVDHSWDGDVNDGYHDKVTLAELASDPTNVANTAILFTRAVSGTAELFIRFEGGTVEQLTSGGRLLLDGSNNSDAFVRSNATDTVSGAHTHTGAVTISNAKLTLEGTSSSHFLDIDVTDGSTTNIVRFQNNGSETAHISYNPSGDSMDFDNFGGGVKIDGNDIFHEGNREIPAGTVMVFYQASAPTGWSKITSVNNRMLYVTSGSGGNNGNYDSSVSPHILTVAQMPSHDHNGSTGGQTAAGLQIQQNNASEPLIDCTNVSQGAGWTGSNIRDVSNHSHAIADEGGDAAHIHDITIPISNVILCSKNS